ncbi:hypothetical protein [Patulibacter defluvii]|uniref:hypothetical protein n=1 Tax=Patulibacter defluvii TaxID=3095358 RepID=UPI002A75EE83|nr:hypothetical protein [Patulibacter sp. DM4]
MTGRGSVGEQGQAAVEVVALAPLALLALAALAVALQAQRAGEAAGAAVHAAGVARLQGRDPLAAARAAVPGLAPDRLAVHVRGDRVQVRVRAAGPRALVARFDAERTVLVRPIGNDDR